MASSKVDTSIPPEKKNNQVKKESEVAIISILEKSFHNNDIQEEKFEIPNKLLKEEKLKSGTDNNITLFNALYNSLINKDHKSFLFCIQQNNETLIEETVKQMNNDCLGKFIEKSLDIFQSNSYYTKQILPWMKKIIKYKKVNILTKNNIENLCKIQLYIKDKIKCFNNLCLLKQKMNKINEIFCASPPSKNKSDYFLKKNDKNDVKNNDKPVIFEPLLTYYESDDEEEVKENEIKKNKMEIEGFEEMNNENNEEDEEMEGGEDEKEESEEDYLDEEIDNMDIDENKFKNKKIDKDKIKELDDEEEENEDDDDKNSEEDE